MLTAFEDKTSFLDYFEDDFAPLGTGNQKPVKEYFKDWMDRKLVHRHIGPSISFSLRSGFTYGKVTAKPWFLEWIKANMLPVGYDSISYEVIENVGGDFLLVVKYSVIIGSRWVAYLNRETLPGHVLERMGEWADEVQA